MNWKYLFILISILSLLFISACENETKAYLGNSNIFPITPENEELSLSPTELTVDQGESETTTLTIRNLESDTITVSATVEAIAFGGETTDDLICGFDDTGLSNTNTYDLSPGESLDRTLIAKDEGVDLGTYVCSVTVSGFTNGDETISLIINIE